MTTETNAGIDLQNLEANDKQDLLEYARDERGLTVPDNAQARTIIKMIREDQGISAPDDTDDLEEDDYDDDMPENGAFNPNNKADKKPLHSKRRHRMINIRIPKQPGKSGADDVQVQVQGKAYLIKRNVEVAVPYFVVEALNNAIETQYEEHEDENGRREQVANEVPSYPFQILGEA